MAPDRMEYKRLLGTVLLVTVVLGPALAIPTGVHALIGVVYAVGFFLVTPAIAWFGDDLPIVRNREDGPIGRKLGREYESGRSGAHESGK